MPRKWWSKRIQESERRSFREVEENYDEEVAKGEQAFIRTYKYLL